MVRKQLAPSKFQAKSLKYRIEYSKYWQNSTRNKEKFMLIYNKNTQLLFLTTFHCTKKVFEIWQTFGWDGSFSSIQTVSTRICMWF